jgi:hypothetical protein
VKFDKRKDRVSKLGVVLGDGSSSRSPEVSEEQQGSPSSGCRFSISDSDIRRCNVILEGKENNFSPEAIWKSCQELGIASNQHNQEVD